MAFSHLASFTEIYTLGKFQWPKFFIFIQLHEFVHNYFINLFEIFSKVTCKFEILYANLKKKSVLHRCKETVCLAKINLIIIFAQYSETFLLHILLHIIFFIALSINLIIFSSLSKNYFIKMSLSEWSHPYFWFGQHPVL